MFDLIIEIKVLAFQKKSSLFKILPIALVCFNSVKKTPVLTINNDKGIYFMSVVYLLITQEYRFFTIRVL